MNVTKPILSVSCLCEQGVETHSAKKSFLRFGDGHEPLIRKSGVHFVKAQTVNACVRADGCTDNTRGAYKITGDQKSHECNPTGAQKTREHMMTGAQKTRDEYELMDAQKTRGEYELMGAQKNSW